jgi:hypothetical protein
VFALLPAGGVLQVSGPPLPDPLQPCQTVSSPHCCITALQRITAEPPQLQVNRLAFTCVHSLHADCVYL